jgi:hypothetical protein
MPLHARGPVGDHAKGLRLVRAPAG